MTAPDGVPGLNEAVEAVSDMASDWAFRHECRERVAEVAVEAATPVIAARVRAATLDEAEKAVSDVHTLTRPHRASARLIVDECAEAVRALNERGGRHALMSGRDDSADEAAGEPEWKRCEHAWCYHSQGDLPISIGRCMLCGHFDGADVQRQIDALLTEAHRKLDEIDTLISEWASADNEKNIKLVTLPTRISTIIASSRPAAPVAHAWYGSDGKTTCCGKTQDEMDYYADRIVPPGFEGPVTCPSATPVTDES